MEMGSPVDPIFTLIFLFKSAMMIKKVGGAYEISMYCTRP